MNENLDLTKIFDGCPKGTKFYSTIFGEVEFYCIDKGNYPVIFMTKGNNPISITKSGKHLISFDGECILFPSKDQRDWSKFVRFWDKPKVEKINPKTFQPFDKVLVRDRSNGWTCALFSHIDTNVPYPVYSSSGCFKFCIPYNDETKHLVGTTEDCPDYYKWWEK